MKKPIQEKLQTKLSKLQDDGKLTISAKQVKVGRKILFKYSITEISYSKTRYFPRMKEDVIQEDYEATILINHETLKRVLTGNISNPPRGVKRVLDMVRHLNPKLNKIIVGGPENKIEGSILYIKLDLYLILTTIYREEGRDRTTRVRNRVAPFLEESYSLVSTEATTVRDYSILLQEAIANRKISQSDIVALTSQLETGENIEIVITKQINKQAQ